MSILSSKISDAHRDVALVLTDLLVTLQGNSFIRASVVSDSNIPPISHAQWISLILHLAGAELRVLLDAYSSKRDSLRESRMIPVTCHLLEQTLACLFDESLYVQPNVILPLRDTLRDLFVSATDFLFDQFVSPFLIFVFFKIIPRHLCTKMIPAYVLVILGAV